MTQAFTNPFAGVTDKGPEGKKKRAFFKRYGLVLVGATLAVWSACGEARYHAKDRRGALAEVFTKRGYSVRPENVVFMDGAKGTFGSLVYRARAFVIASPKGEPNAETDLYLVDTRLSPSGVLLDVYDEINLSQTTGAEETSVVVAGTRVAYISKSLTENAPDTVTLLDFAGQKPTNWSRFERTQNAITNYQETGQFIGVDKHVLAVTGAQNLSLGLNATELDLVATDKNARLMLGPMRFTEPASWITVQPNELAHPGDLVPWSVDRVRLVIGTDNMQWVKQLAFTISNYIDARKEALTNDTGEKGIAEDLGQDLSAPKKIIPVDPDLGWPPAPLEPWVTPALPGEGEWNAKDDVDWFRQQPNLPSTFLTTFIRTDRTRKATRVYVALWDPRQVELHMMAGTVEPKGATGNAGPGLIPRTPDVMKRVVAASNAGFQAQHGEFGMMADGVVYLPPKPYGATVAELSDGSTALGTWPESPAIPDNILSYRQNMTVMVQDQKWNPYNRTWWGGTAPDIEDKIHTVRTGICLTAEKFIAYFYGADLSPESLGQAMIQARCNYGVALDMNAGHAGMEFYKIGPEAEIPSLAGALQPDEAEGSVPEMPGWNFRARRLIRGMGLMNFPRYVKREARDFFFLTLRHVLPGENVDPIASPAKDGEGKWRVKGLPQHGFPYAMAITDLRPDKSNPGLNARILELDPRTLVQGGAKDTEDNTVLVADAGRPGKTSLWFSNKAFSIADAEPGRGALRIASGESDASTGSAVLGVSDESGMLFYVEVLGDGDKAKTDIKSIKALLTKLGCSQTLVLETPLPLALGGAMSLGGDPVKPPAGKTVIRLIRGDAATGQRLFPDTPIVAKDVWYPLQQERIRYMHKRE